MPLVVKIKFVTLAAAQVTQILDDNVNRRFAMHFSGNGSNTYRYSQATDPSATKGLIGATFIGQTMTYPPKELLPVYQLSQYAFPTAAAPWDLEVHEWIEVPG